MGRHVVFPVELLAAHGARIGFSVQVCSHIMPVEIGWMSVCVIAHLASVGVALLDAEAPNADGIGSAFRIGHIGFLAG